MTYKNLSIKILQKLRENGRQSLRELAEQLDVSATTIGKRIEKLREQGVLKGITADIEYSKLGYTYVAITRFKVIGDSISEALHGIEQHPQLTDVYEITGDYDILAIGRYRDRDEMNQIIKQLQGRDEIQATNTSIVLNTVRENFPPPLGSVETAPELT